MELLLYLSDNLVLLKRVKNGLDGSDITGATAKATLYTDAALETEVSGPSWPLDLAETQAVPAADQPAYVGTVGADINVSPGDTLWAKVEVDGGSGLARTWRVKVRVDWGGD